jgi:hypothetical protein
MISRSKSSIYLSRHLISPLPLPHTILQHVPRVPHLQALSIRFVVDDKGLHSLDSGISDEKHRIQGRLRQLIRCPELLDLHEHFINNVQLCNKPPVFVSRPFVVDNTW